MASSRSSYGDADLVDGVVEQRTALRSIDGRPVAQLAGAQLHGQGEEPLLGTVVQVALDTVPLGGLRRDDPRPRLADLLELKGDLRAAARCRAPVAPRWPVR